MKKIGKIAFTVLLFVGVYANAQTQLKKGSVTYSMTMPNTTEEMAAMGESTITVHFDEKTQATDMSMMGGMMLMKTIVPNENKKDSKMTVEVMGMKYEITDAGEEASKNANGVTNLDNAKDIVYDKKDTKEIAGFKCYKATVNMNDGTKSAFYITEAIAPQMGASKSNLKLAGYPLEITTQTAQGEMVMKAIKFSKDVPAEAFKVGEGFTKTTMEEFQKQMGGM
jgi:GLPGLI family protein